MRFLVSTGLASFQKQKANWVFYYFLGLGSASETQKVSFVGLQGAFYLEIYLHTNNLRQLKIYT